MLTKILITCATVALISSCATRPDKIAAATVAQEKYAAEDCATLSKKFSQTQTELTALSKKQNSKANGDIWGVLLIFTPISFFTGDFEKEIAQKKGDIVAIQASQRKNNCSN